MDSKQSPVPRRDRRIFVAGLALALAAFPALAQKKYDPGASDSEIVIGNIVPYSGPASGYAIVGKTMAAYFDKVNAEGGINGRKVRFISLDDGYNPAKTVEQARKLVEQEKVLFIVGSLGTAQNTAIQKYMNGRKVPQLFVASGAAKWNDPKHFPWTIGFNPSYETEGKTYGKHLAETKPDAKIAVLFQNDDLGKDYVRGFKAGLGPKAKDMIAAEASFEVSDPTIDSQILTLKGSGANVIVYFATPKATAQALKKVGELGWRPVQYLSSVSVSIDAVLKPAGFDNAKGAISTNFMKEPGDKQWQNGPEFKDWQAFMTKYNAASSQTDSLGVYAASLAQLTTVVLKNMGDDLTRENVMKQASRLDTALPMMLPGIRIRTTPDDYRAIRQLELITFDGARWTPSGKIYGD